MDRALINTVLGDGHFWRHPESVNSNIVWTSTVESWLKWKSDHLVPIKLKSRLRIVRKANAKGCYPNSKPLFELKTHVDPRITDAHDSWDKSVALSKADLKDLAIWYVDDGSAVLRKDTNGSYRIIISVGDLTADVLFPEVARILGMPEKSLGKVRKNNSKATERNKSWIIPKPVAVQILSEARKIAPQEFAYKVPLW